jgi:hypothetical protein
VTVLLGKTFDMIAIPAKKRNTTTPMMSVLGG